MWEGNCVDPGSEEIDIEWKRRESHKVRAEDKLSLLTQGEKT